MPYINSHHLLTVFKPWEKFSNNVGEFGEITPLPFQTNVNKVGSC